jgi:hypothetical protein
VVPVAVQRLLRPKFAVELQAELVLVGLRIVIGVVQGEAEPLGQRQRRGVLGVDELGVFLDQLRIVEMTP